MPWTKKRKLLDSQRASRLVSSRSSAFTLKPRTSTLRSDGLNLKTWVGGALRWPATDEPVLVVPIDNQGVRRKDQRIPPARTRGRLVSDSISFQYWHLLIVQSIAYQLRQAFSEKALPWPLCCVWEVATNIRRRSPSWKTTETVGAHRKML